MYEPSVLVIVGTNHAVANTGVNQATRQFHQVALGRACFDDTKVRHADALVVVCMQSSALGPGYLCFTCRTARTAEA